MIDFKDLTITGSPNVMDSLVETLADNAPIGWTRNMKHEDFVRTDEGRELIGCFVRDEAPGRPGAAVFLMGSGSSMRVTNVVPTLAGRLAINEYNSVIDEFAKLLAEPAVEALGLSMKVSQGRADVKDNLSSEAFKALEAFSQSANKSTGFAHSSDRERWMEFLLLAHSNQSDLPLWMLERWLVEEEGWPEEHAVELVSNYEFALDLLGLYDNRRRS